MLPELLSPANSFDTAQAAFDHGADAVYVGVGQFNLRAHATGFDPDQLAALITNAKAIQKKVYVVINIFPDDEKMQGIEQTLQRLSQTSILPDAFIVSDPGVIACCQEYLPAVPLHLSTQTGTFNRRSMSFWKSQGIARVILPRELSLSQIAFLNEPAILPTEVFIHGAMCVSVSGRCLLGAYITQRHPNFGDCPQPCRVPYKITPILDKNQTISPELELHDTQSGSYILNSCDLCTLSILPQIIGSGVSSLKIEGRNKSIHYISAVTKVYRAALDRYAMDPENFAVEQWWERELEQLDHRPYTTGFFSGATQMQAVFAPKAQSGIRLVGLVRERCLDGKVIIDVKNDFLAGEKLSVLPVNSKKAPFEITLSELTDVAGKPVARALPNRLVCVDDNRVLRSGDLLRRVLGDLSIGS